MDTFTKCLIVSVVVCVIVAIVHAVLVKSAEAFDEWCREHEN